MTRYQVFCCPRLAVSVCPGLVVRFGHFRFNSLRDHVGDLGLLVLEAMLIDKSSEVEVVRE